MTYAPQKGAGPLEAMVLERCLTHYGRICESYADKDLVKMKGTGAAGGVAVGIMAFFDTRLFPGTSFILDKLEGDAMIRWADIVITAEGRLDNQTADGKAPAIIAQKSKDAGKKVICIAGEVPNRSDQSDKLFDAVFSLQNKPMTLSESIENTLDNIRSTAFEIGRLISMKVT
jgi:glycerate kinase